MRIRTIKPEFFLHDGLFDAEQAEKLPLRLAYAGLWCAADREGRFRWEPRRLGVAILPYDNIDFSRVLDALRTRGFLVKYRVSDVWYGAILSFARHQVINNREAKSQLPAPGEGEPDFPSESTQENPRVPHACPTRASRDEHAASGEGKGRERKGKEENPLTPLQGESPSAENPQSQAQTPKGALQLRAERLMRRRPETPLTENESRAFRRSKAAIEATTEAQWQALERYYAAPQSETYSRKDLAALVNNWNGEIDRALAWSGKASAAPARRVKTAEDFAA